ncbi:MAG: DUF4897 domain-containing protein [Halodesulfurarchaeum sp.]
MYRSGAVSALVLALLITATAVPASAGVSRTQQDGLQTSVDPDRVIMTADVHPNGTASWQIEYLVRLETENETAAFEDLMRDVSNNSSEYVDRFANRMNATVADAEETTGRQMDARQYSVSAHIRTLGNRYGVLTYRFTWVGFAAVDGETLRMGDALAGLYLDQETSLEFSWPETYEVVKVTPDPTTRRANSVVWRGPMDFDSGEPTLVLTTSPEMTTTTTTQTTPMTPTTPGGPGGPGDSAGGGLPVAWIGGLVVVLIAGIAMWYRQRSSSETPVPVGSTDSGDDEPPEDLLSNEERVIRVLESRGGRAKQQEIVDELGWTEAKTSQVLSNMQSSGDIDKFRIGRENVVKLPDEEDEIE